MNRILFATIYLIIDILWITTMSKHFYQPKISKIQYGKPMSFKPVFAILAYITLLIVLFFIAIPLATYYEKKYPKWFVFSIVGFCIYGVYNFTNGAILHNYDVSLIVVDTLWGVSSFALLGYLHSMRV